MKIQNILFLSSRRCFKSNFLFSTTKNENLMGFYQFCQHRNYPIEKHQITTKDNYNLQYYRIQKKNTAIANLEKVVYLQHGLTDSSDCWVRNEEHLATGFKLANQGYDVWLGNIRGNTYSNHQLTPKKTAEQYWNFTFDQIAEYDLPAAFNYISSKTNKKIHYVGHSQGTLIMFIALSQQIKEVQNSLASFCALGPVAYLTNVRSLVFKLPILDLLRHTLNAKAFPLCELNGDIHKLVDSFGFILESALRFIGKIGFNQGVEFFADQDHMNINNLKGVDGYRQRYPAGSSSKNVAHFIQYVLHPEFCKYDHLTKAQNRRHYGQDTPPKYNLGNIKFPAHLFVGQNDKLATIKDAQRIMSELVNSPKSTMRPYPNYGHLTFLLSKDAGYVNDVISIIEKSK